MIKDELFCFVCAPFVNERGSRQKRSDCDVNYMIVNMMACDGVERAGFIPISPTHLWSYCFKDIYNRYDNNEKSKDRIDK